MGDPILLVRNAGTGETPPCDSKFGTGDVVKRRNLKWLAGLPDVCVIAAVVPPGFPPEYALADAKSEPRPLMISRSSRVVRYIVGFEGSAAPYILKESDIRERVDRGASITWDQSNG